MTDQLEIADLLRSAQFASLSTFLEKGGHVGPESGARYDFMRRHLVLINEFYSTWRSAVVESDQCYHLVGDPEHFGRRHLGRHQMLVGAIVCSVRLDPGTFADGIGVDDFIQRVEMAIGSTDDFLQLFAPQTRSRSDIERRESARERVERCLRELEALGFLDLVEDAGGYQRVLPLGAVHRFSLPAQMSGGDPSRIAEAVAALTRRGLLHHRSIRDDDE